MTVIRKATLQRTNFQNITNLTTIFCTPNYRFGVNQPLKFSDQLGRCKNLNQPILQL